MLKKLLKWLFYGLVLTIILLFIAAFIPYNNTSYSYLDMIRLKGCHYIENNSYEGLQPNDILNYDVIDTLNVPAYEISFDEEVHEYFDDLWRGYEDGFDGIFYTEKGQEYYLEHRKWQDAIFKSPSGEYKVQIRSHGKLPDNHHYGENFSFQIKSDELVQEFGVKKLKFIIYQRIKEKDDHLDFIEEQFGLLRAKSNEMVKVSMNGNPNHLFFIESSELAPSLLSANKIIQEVGEHSSGISAMSNDIEVDKDEFTKIIFQKQYALFQTAIDEGDFEYVLNASDEDYLLNYFTVKAIYGFSGHECYPANFFLYFDTLNLKFYPAISREPVFNNLPGEEGFSEALSTYNHAIIDRTATILSYYKTVLASPEFFAKLKVRINEIIEVKSSALIENWNKNRKQHRMYLQDDFMWYFLYPDKGLMSLENNLDWLEGKIEE